MEYLRIGLNWPDLRIILKVKKVLQAGGVIAVPTETVYGLAGDLFSPEAVRKIYALKKREQKKPLPVFIPSVETLPLYASEIPPLAMKLIQHLWPGPLTVILRRKEGLSIPFETSTLGFRIPDHPVTLRLLEEFGPMAQSSANPSGEKEAITAEEVEGYFNKKIDLILDGGRTLSGIPSTVVDFTSPVPKVIREGHFTKKQIQKILSAEQAKVQKDNGRKKIKREITFS